jgi:hypothetical protein
MKAKLGSKRVSIYDCGAKKGIKSFSEYTEKGKHFTCALEIEPVEGGVLFTAQRKQINKPETVSTTAFIHGVQVHHIVDALLPVLKEYPLVRDKSF